MAQSGFLNFGPRLGVQSSTMRVDQSIANYDAETGESELGFHAGFYARIQLAGFYIQPELLYVAGGGTIRWVDQDNLAGGSIDQDINFNRVDIPVMVGKRFLRVLRVNAGPNFSYYFNQEAAFGARRQEFLDATNTASGDDREGSGFTLGYQAGVGIDLGKFALDAKYEGSLNRIGSTVGGFQTDARNTQWVFSIGYTLF